MSILLAAVAASTEQRRPSCIKLEVADIFRRYGADYRILHPLTPEQGKAMSAIEACRTPLLGGHRTVCDDCRYERIDYNSCRNRHCPKCQALAQARWIAQRQLRILPVPHYHVVFTLPSQLRAVAASNRRDVFALLFRAATQTLLELGADSQWLGVQLGITAVLHTWNRKLDFHPHLHCVVTAGGLALEGSPRWIHSDPNFLFPVRVLSALFRGKFLDGLQNLYRSKQLHIPNIDSLTDPDSVFARLKGELYNMGWVVYAKSPFAGPKHVFQYLGRYTHRVAISNQRLIDINDNGVCFATKDGRTATLPPDEFIRRFLMHILPAHFVKIRHYGLLAPSNVNTRLQQARALLTPSTTQTLIAEVNELPHSPWQRILQQLTGINPCECPVCGSAKLTRHELRPVRPNSPRGPPSRDTS